MNGNNIMVSINSYFENNTKLQLQIKLYFQQIHFTKLKQIT
jgi:hypothetical protein